MNYSMDNGSVRWDDIMLLDWRFDGFPGRVLWVDLSQGSVEAKEIPHDWLIESMGGKGLATRLLVEWDTTDYDAAMNQKHPVLDRVDTARHPTNPLLFMTGPYQASTVGSSGRAVVVTRSQIASFGFVFAV